MAINKIVSNMDKPAIELAIKRIENRGRELDKDIHLTALSIVAHVVAHKEVSLAIKLFNAMPKGSRANALVAWFIGYGPIAVNMDKATKKQFPLVLDKDRVALVDMQAASDNPWFNFKKEKAPSEEFNLDEAFSKFMSNVHAKMKAGKVEPTGELAKALYDVERLFKEQMAAKVAPVANPDATPLTVVE